MLMLASYVLASVGVIFLTSSLLKIRSPFKEKPSKFLYLNPNSTNSILNVAGLHVLTKTDVMISIVTKSVKEKEGGRDV